MDQYHIGVGAVWEPPQNRPNTSTTYCVAKVPDRHERSPRLAAKSGPGPGDVWGEKGTGACALGESTSANDYFSNRRAEVRQIPSWAINNTAGRRSTRRS